jgi:hypothetical protein
MKTFLRHPWPEGLSYEERFDVVRKALRQHGKVLRTRSNVLSVGMGLKHQRVEGDLVRMSLVSVQRHWLHEHDEVLPCLTVVVSRKWPVPGRRRKDALPRSVPMRARVRGQVYDIAVPVDVVEAIPAHLHSWECTAVRDSDAELGTAACLVRYGNYKQPYLLSCHHVLALSAKQEITNGAPITIGYEDKSIATSVFVPSSPWACDAAVAQSPSADWASDDVVPKLKGVWPGSGALPAEGYALTRNGRVAISFVAIDGPYTTPSAYAGGQSVTFPRRIIANASDGQFQESDSGSALVTADGVVVAMHFAGLVGGGPVSYAVPMIDVFQAFSLSMHLWNGK